jgi:hypothetical protein
MSESTLIPREEWEPLYCATPVRWDGKAHYEPEHRQLIYRRIVTALYINPRTQKRVIERQKYIMFAHATKLTTPGLVCNPECIIDWFAPVLGNMRLHVISVRYTIEVAE